MLVVNIMRIIDSYFTTQDLKPDLNEYKKLKFRYI